MRASYSFIKLGEKCGAAWHYRYVLRLTDVSGAAAQRGKRLHKAAERYLAGEIPEQQLPVEFWKIKTWLEVVRALKPMSEQTIYLDESWQLCEPQQAAWIFVIDISWVHDNELNIVDLKSGRAYDSHAEQLQLYATAKLSVLPRLPAATVAAIYTDTGQKLYETRYTREMLPQLQEHWSQRRIAVINGERKPNPSFNNCRFCSFAASRGGPCENEWKEQQ